MFETASKKKLRFASAKGLLSTEDLWDLPLTSPGRTKVDLDTIAKSIAKELREADEDSFVTKSAGNGVTTLKLEIVKHIIAYKLKLADDRVTAAARRGKNELIMEVLAQKEIDELKGKTAEELRAELAK